MKKILYVTRDKEWQLIQQLSTTVNNSNFNPKDTCLLMVSPDYSATVAMHLAHAWSRDGEMLPIIPVEVPYPDESSDTFIHSMSQLHEIKNYKKAVLVEAGIIRGGNWKWILQVLSDFGFDRKDITLVTMYENISSITKSDYVAEYYDAEKEDLTFYYERYNKHWD